MAYFPHSAGTAHGAPPKRLPADQQQDNSRRQFQACLRRLEHIRCVGLWVLIGYRCWNLVGPGGNSNRCGPGRHAAKWGTLCSGWSPWCCCAGVWCASGASRPDREARRMAHWTGRNRGRRRSHATRVVVPAWAWGPSFTAAIAAFEGCANWASRLASEAVECVVEHRPPASLEHYCTFQKRVAQGNACQGIRLWEKRLVVDNWS